MFKIKIKKPQPPGLPGAAITPNKAATPIPLSSSSVPAPEIKTPKLKIRQSSSSTKVLLRKSYTAGLGYDSEASDREDDPLIETHVILRFKPGSEANYVREQIDAKNPLDDISIKFKDSRNAVVTVREKMFAARLVDLPTITEVHKSFDKKNIFKVADICQMLVVGDRISHEETVLALPSQPKDYVYPHGLTPPLRHVRQRRFRKRASAKTIEGVEKEVDRLLSMDAASERTTYEIMDRDQLIRDQTMSPRGGMLEMVTDQDADAGDDSDEDDLAAQLEAQLASPSPPGTPVPNVGQGHDSSPHPHSGPLSPGASSDGSDVGSDEDEDISPEDMAKKAGQKRLRDEIVELRGVIEGKRKEAETAVNPILKQRLIAIVRRFEGELEMKMSESEE